MVTGYYLIAIIHLVHGSSYSSSSECYVPFAPMQGYYHRGYCDDQQSPALLHRQRSNGSMSADMSTQTGDQMEPLSLTPAAHSLINPNTFTSSSFNSKPDFASNKQPEDPPKIKYIIKRLPSRGPLHNLKEALSSEFGGKLLFFIVQLGCILVSLNLIALISMFKFPKILRFLLCLNTGKLWRFLSHFHGIHHSIYYNLIQYTAMLALYNIITVTNSILYLDKFNLTFLFSMHWSSLFTLFYILSLRVCFSCIINIYFMNLIIWSWVHSRLREMQRLISASSASAEKATESLSTLPFSPSSFNTQSSISSVNETITTPDIPHKCPTTAYEIEPNYDWWSIIYNGDNHCLFRRSLFSIILIIVSMISYACFIQEIISINDVNTNSNPKQPISFDTSTMGNLVYRWYFIMPNTTVYILSCVCWILAIFVEHKKTFVMDLCEKETARLLKMIGIGYIITLAIFLPTLMVNPAVASKQTRDVCYFCCFYRKLYFERFHILQAIELLRHAGQMMQCVVDCAICCYWSYTKNRNDIGTLSIIGGIDTNNKQTPKRVLRTSSPSRSMSDKNKLHSNTRGMISKSTSNWAIKDRVPLSDIPFTDGMRKIQRTLDGRNWRVCMGVKKQLEVISETSVWQTSIKECTETGFSFSSSDGSGSFNLLKWNDLVPNNNGNNGNKQLKFNDTNEIIQEKEEKTD